MVSMMHEIKLAYLYFVTFVRFVCGLFNNIHCSSDFTASDDGMISKNKLERTWKEAVMPYVKVLSLEGPD
jgi:hypothetical protein